MLIVVSPKPKEGMSNIVPIEQANYNQGMILGVRQDSSFERNDMQSVYWLENLNPNNILGELHTRKAQEQDVNGTTDVETTISGEPISALEMTHAVATNPDTSVLHIFSTESPTIRTSSLYRTSFDDGVWSTDTPTIPQVFQFPVSDYDVYGESVLLVSDKENVLDSPKRRPVYAYTYKDYDQYFGQKNESNKDLFLYGITPKPNTGVQRWEVLDEESLDKIATVKFDTEDVPPTDPEDYRTVEAPFVNGKMVSVVDATLLVSPDIEFDVELKMKDYKVRSGSDIVTVKGYSYGGDEGVNTITHNGTGTLPGDFVNTWISYQPSDAVLQDIGAVFDAVNIVASSRALYQAPTQLPATYLSPEPEYQLTPYPSNFPVYWKVQDYVQKKKARPFFIGERIPYILTAVVNGIEKIVKKDTYKVHSTTDDIVAGKIAEWDMYNFEIDEIDPVPDDSYSQPVFGSTKPIGTESKRVHFNLELNVQPEQLPIGLTEFRLYIANKNVGERGLFNYVFTPPSFTEVSDPTTTYNGWIVLPESLYRNPDTDRESFSYTLAKSFVVFGDPDLYARRAVDTNHSNWGVNNIKVNDWRLDGTKIVGANLEGADIRSEFYIWDYMDRAGEPLASNLQQALFLWKGKGAKVLASMKGVTFIGACRDSIGKLETGLIRKSLLQGAVQSTDTFAETDFIKVGNETHTALVEFRGQLWAYSRTQMHRIQMRDMADLDTIEVLEVLENNGTFHPKTVIATPFGVAWCNEAGVWLSNGGEPTLLSKEIEPLYLSMVRGTEWISQTGDRLDWNIGTDLYNKNLQIVYDNAQYDLTISAFAIRLPNLINPEGDDRWLDVRCCYNIIYKNWRVETYPLNLTHTKTSFVSHHRTHWSFGKYKSLGWRDSDIQVNTVGNGLTDFTALLIDNRLTLHEIGNGIDDMQANSVSVEAAYLIASPLTIPRLTLTTGQATGQFQFPGQQNTTDPVTEGELVSYHISGIADPYWSENKVDTPIETPAETTAMLSTPVPLRMTYSMTSQHHHVPFMKPVRRFMAEYSVRGRVRLRSLRFFLRLFTRKFWG